MKHRFPQFDRRSFLVALGASALAAGTARAADPATLSLGWVKSTSNLLAPVSVDLAAKQGLTIKSVNFNNAQDALTAMVNGELDIGLLTPIHLLRAIDTGLDFVQIAGNTRGGTGIVAASKLDLKENDWEGLRTRLKDGKLKVASSRGSINELLAIGEFRENGISLIKDLDLMNIPNFAQHPQALRSGEFDLIVTLEPMATMSVADGTGTLLSHPYESAAGDLNTNYVARRGWLDANGEKARMFVQTLAAAKAALENKPFEIMTAVKLTGLPQPVIQSALGNTRYELRNGKSQTEALAKLAAEVRYVSRDLSADLPAHIDDRYLQQAGLPV